MPKDFKLAQEISKLQYLTSSITIFKVPFFFFIFPANALKEDVTHSMQPLCISS